MLGRSLLVYPLFVFLLGIATLHALFPSGHWQLPAIRSWREYSMLGLSCYLLLVSWFLARRMPLQPPLRAFNVPVIASLVLLGCWLGTRIVMQDHFSSRDEQMAVFDARIFASGRLFEALPQGWSDEAQALNLEFILPLDRQAAWVSAYLPMNAAIRSVFAQFSIESLTSPALAAGAILLVWSCARALWPEDRGAAAVAVLGLAGSGQFILTGMTPSAMTAHLFLSLLWLRLFLADRGRCDAAALVVGFVATGLHQPVFHPLFVAPFLTILLLRRQWRRLLPFFGGYLLICGFWLAWPGLIADLAGGAAPASGQVSVDYLDRLRATLHVDQSNLALFAYNAAGFAGWQHLLILPLAAMGVWQVRHLAVGRALAASVLLPFVVMTIILPDQGFGYGYRYVHGALGSVALLAGYGWHGMATAERVAARPMLAWTTAFSVLVLVPFQMWSAFSSLRPFASAERRIANSQVDFFVLETANGRYVENLAFNAPGLDRRPVRIIAERVTNPPALAGRLCRSGTVVGFGSEVFYTHGFEPFRDPVPATAGAVLRAAFQKAGCSIRFID